MAHVVAVGMTAPAGGGYFRVFQALRAAKGRAQERTAVWDWI